VAEVRGRDAEGRRFAESTILQDVSAGGLFVNLNRDVPLATKLFVVFTFKTDVSQGAPAPKVASLGEVRRIEKSEGAMVHGIGIEFQHHRFL